METFSLLPFLARTPDTTGNKFVPFFVSFMLELMMIDTEEVQISNHTRAAMFCVNKTSLTLKSKVK
ncbi:hypothetical protein Pyn_34413 [Prunus yedoensis var. nudiflora]|uniref:Uncharacterized protein n=1 Tax=Prunus yedoensis var. nudiflora TaxID=2094558 RepID=A0A314ZM21_PRUYE|nr:hypothetical protein Pyn_34413 [Prunus yedoensis var. nudiflora]